jgi:hypothetical protein
MVKRCTNPNSKSYKDYGAKGIVVCKEWLESFEIFLKDMGYKPDKNYSIERIDSKSNYEPSNCKWATSLEQNNNKSDNRKVINVITNEQYSSID